MARRVGSPFVGAVLTVLLCGWMDRHDRGTFVGRRLDDGSVYVWATCQRCGQILKGD